MAGQLENPTDVLKFASLVETYFPYLHIGRETYKIFNIIKIEQFNREDGLD